MRELARRSLADKHASGLVSEAESATLQAHFSHCGSCRSFLAALRESMHDMGGVALLGFAAGGRIGLRSGLLDRLAHVGGAAWEGLGEVPGRLRQLAHKVGGALPGSDGLRALSWAPARRSPRSVPPVRRRRQPACSPARSALASAVRRRCRLRTTQSPRPRCANCRLQQKRRRQKRNLPRAPRLPNPNRRPARAPPSLRQARRLKPSPSPLLSPFPIPRRAKAGSSGSKAPALPWNPTRRRRHPRRRGRAKAQAPVSSAARAPRGLPRPVALGSASTAEPLGYRSAGVGRLVGDGTRHRQDLRPR